MKTPPSPIKEAYAKKCVLGTGEERQGRSVVPSCLQKVVISGGHEQRPSY